MIVVLNQEIHLHKPQNTTACLDQPIISTVVYSSGPPPHQLVKTGTKTLTQPIFPTVTDQDLCPSPLLLIKARTKSLRVARSLPGPD